MFSARGGWALAVQSCTSALWIAGSILHKEEADEIIVPAITYAGCAAAFLKAGWRVRFADVDSTTGLVDLADVAKRITPRTRALLVVDTYGQRAPMGDARKLCDAHGIGLIHDAAHRIDLGDPQCSPADFVCYSFGPVKEAPSPEGGLLWSSHPKYAEQARSLSMVGLNLDTWTRTRDAVHAKVAISSKAGLKLRQNDICAAFALEGLRGLSAARAQRRQIYDWYKEALARTPVELTSRHHDDSLLMMYCRVAAPARDRVRHALADKGIATSDHYPSLAESFGNNDDCPRAKRFAQEVMILPMHALLTRDDIEYICSAVGAVATATGT